MESPPPPPLLLLLVAMAAPLAVAATAAAEVAPPSKSVAPPLIAWGGGGGGWGGGCGCGPEEEEVGVDGTTAAVTAHDDHSELQCFWRGTKIRDMINEKALLWYLFIFILKQRAYLLPRRLENSVFHHVSCTGHWA